MSLLLSKVDALFSSRRDRLYQIAEDRDRPRLPILESFHWNLDVTLTTA